MQCCSSLCSQHGLFFGRLEMPALWPRRPRGLRTRRVSESSMYQGQVFMPLVPNFPMQPYGGTGVLQRVSGSPYQASPHQLARYPEKYCGIPFWARRGAFRRRLDFAFAAVSLGRVGIPATGCAAPWGSLRFGDRCKTKCGTKANVRRTHSPPPSKHGTPYGAGERQCQVHHGGGGSVIPWLWR